MKRIGLLLLAMALILSMTGCHVVDQSNSGLVMDANTVTVTLEPGTTEEVINDATTSNHSDQNSTGAEDLQKSSIKIPALNARLAAAASTSEFIYWPQAGSPAYVQNFAHPDAGCNWMGIAGQVFDTQGNPVSNVVVNIGGKLGGSAVSSLGMTGTSRIYGSAAYEVVLGSQAQDSSASIWVQLSDLSGKPVSQRFSLRTYAACDKNLIVLNFREIPGMAVRAYLPIVGVDNVQ